MKPAFAASGHAVVVLIAVVAIATLVVPAAALDATPEASPYFVIDLGTLGGPFTASSATAINDSGMAIGQSRTADWSRQHAFAWTPAGGMVDLGTLGGDYSFAAAVNAAGQVVGSSTTATGETHAFSWTRAGGMVDLGTLGYPNSAAGAVNDSGQVVGSRWLDYSIDSHAFLWTAAGGMVEIAMPGYANSSGSAINAGGQVVGSASNYAAGGEARPFSWTAGGGIVDLGSLGGTNPNSPSRATALNDSGQVVGASATPGGALHAFSWTQAGGMVDLGTLGGGFSQAAAVNAAGQVVGWSDSATGSMPHAFSWTQADGMVDLGTLGDDSYYSSAQAVNDSGQVVGWSAPITGQGHAFSWTQAGGMVDLGALSGSSYSFAFAVNETGQVVGTSYFADGTTRATLWTTDTTPPTLSAPVGLAVDATSPGGAVVAFVVSAADDFDPAPAVGCSPESGATFPIGDTTVVCAAADTSGNRASASFTVHVRGAGEQLRELEALVESYHLEHGLGSDLTRRLNVALKSLDRARTEHARQQLRQFLAAVDRAAAKDPARLSPAQAAAVRDAARRILAVLSDG